MNECKETLIFSAFRDGYFIIEKKNIWDKMIYKLLFI